ncbi:MAG: hypothetical protein HOB24_08675 [Chloroflexi bacterium]|nr:hypothetical protein [Chloroflexota bacterium]
MPHISRSTLLISIALMIAVVAAACDSAAEKPTAEPPTAVPAVVSESASTSEGEPAGRIRVPGDLATAGAASLADPQAQECLAGELGMDLSDGEFDLRALSRLDPTDTSAAFVACGAEFGRPGGAGGILGGGEFVGGGFADPEFRECLTGILGDDALDNLGQGDGLGLDPESLAAFEECGINFGDTGGGLQFGGREGAFGGDSGIFGGGLRGGRGGFGGDGSFQECLIGELGEDALSSLRNPTGAPSDEFQAALEKCGGGIAIPVEPDGGIGDGAGPITIEPITEPTATSIPVSELTIEQLTCLSSELDPADLAAAVVATSAGDLSEISDELLAALQTCGVGS